MTAQETFGANFFETEVSTEVGASDLTANVAATTGLAVPCYMVFDPDVPARREVWLVDDSVGATTLVVSNINKRYLSGSAAGSGIVHPVGSKVRCAPVFQHFTDINDRVDAKANDADVAKLTGAQTIAGVKTFSSDPLIPDEAYGSGWNGSLEPPTKNAVYDKIETIASGAVPSNDSAAVSTRETTPSTTYDNLTTSGPSVTVTTGTKAQVTVGCTLSNATAGTASYMSFAVSGASTSAAVDARAFHGKSESINAEYSGSRTILIEGLTPGVNTFTAKYRASAGTAAFENRDISVIDMGS